MSWLSCSESWCYFFSSIGEFYVLMLNLKMWNPSYKIVPCLCDFSNSWLLKNICFTFFFYWNLTKIVNYWVLDIYGTKHQVPSPTHFLQKSNFFTLNSEFHQWVYHLKHRNLVATWNICWRSGKDSKKNHYSDCVSVFRNEMCFTFISVPFLVTKYIFLHL